MSENNDDVDTSSELEEEEYEYDYSDEEEYVEQQQGTDGDASMANLDDGCKAEEDTRKKPRNSASTLHASAQPTDNPNAAPMKGFGRDDTIGSEVSVGKCYKDRWIDRRVRP